MTAKTEQKREIERFNIEKRFVDTTNEPGIYMDEKLTGFGLRVRDKTKTYIYRAKQSGTHRVVLVTIGRHGDKFGNNGETLTLARAREEAAKLRGQLLSGVNPNDEQRKAIKLEQSIKDAEEAQKKLRTLTLRKAFEDYVHDKQIKKSTAYVYKCDLFKCLADWLDEPICGITRDMVTERFDNISRKQNHKGQANHVMRILRAILNYAASTYEDHEGKPLIAVNPVRRLSQLKKWNKLPRRQDVISDANLPAWFGAIQSLNQEIVRDYLLLMIFTGLRAQEAARLKWENVDFKNDMFTVKDTKNGTDHTLPMTATLKSMLKIRWASRKNKYVFPGQVEHKHLVDIRYHIKEVEKQSKVKFTPHTLRRTFTTIAGRLLPEYTVKRLTNHINGADTTQGYVVIEVEKLREPMDIIDEHIQVNAALKKPAQRKEKESGKVLVMQRNARGKKSAGSPSQVGRQLIPSLVGLASS
jgi:integrase